jgi:hypothetical protein
MHSDLKVARNASGTWSVDNISTANTLLRTVSTGSAFNGFGAITATDATSPLPVQLITFEGRAAGNDAVLNWTTASEINSEVFEVERSTDAVNFEYVTSVTARGNSNSRTEYTTTDAGALANNAIMYYRLKQVDKDGSFSYSNVVRVSNLSLNNSTVTVYPNPFNGEFNLGIYSTQAGTAQATVVDLQGRTVMNFAWHVQEGANSLPVDASEQLQKGVYFVRVQLNGEVNTLKVVNLK